MPPRLSLFLTEAVHIDDVNRVNRVKPKEPVVQIAGREPVRSSPADFQQTQYGNGGVERRKLFDKAPVLRVKGIPWIKSIDDEDIAIDEDQSGPLSRIDPFPAMS